MKRSLLFLSFIIGLTFGASAQVCTPDSTHFTSGVFVYPSSLPCIIKGTPFSGTVSIKAPDSLDVSTLYSGLPPHTYYIHVDSIAIDSIVGFPTGISATANPVMGSWLHAGEYGCSLFSGTTNDTLGTYNLTIAGRACGHGTFPIVGVVDTCSAWTFSSQYPYSVNVCAPVPPPVCTPDSTHFTAGKYVYPDSLPCIMHSQAISEVISIMIPDSIDVHNFYAAAPAGLFFAHIDSMRIDSLNGMPAGITAATNPGPGIWLHGGQFGCAKFTGTTTAVAGSYPLNIWGAGCIHGTFPIIGALDTCQSGNLGAYISYALKVCNGVGIVEIANGVDMNIYPNPNQGTFTVSVSSIDHISGQMSVLDQLGRIVHTEAVDVTGAKQIPLVLGSLSPGVYVLVMNTTNGKTVKTFSVR